jgi:two-component system response regulator AdeR
VDPLERQCQKEHLGVTRATSSEQAARLLLGGGPDVVVLDLVLPDDDGFDVMRRIREESDVPVILLSEDGAGVDEVVGLTLGADDVVSRDVTPRLFVARVKALLRRMRSVTGREAYRLGPLELDPGQYRATVRGEEIGLTLSEFRLLAALVRAAGMTLSRRQLIEVISPDGEALERTIDVHVSKLRRKLAGSGLDDVLETVRGVGYRAVPPRG